MPTRARRRGGGEGAREVPGGHVLPRGPGRLRPRRGQLGVDPLDLRGSASGAIGCPQFLPSSYLRYGVDGGGDGRIDPYDVADAAASCANFLAAHGWQANLSERARRTVLWQYNRSDAYVDTVLRLARAMDGGGSGQPAGVCAPVAKRRRAGARVARQTPAAPRRQSP